MSFRRLYLRGRCLRWKLAVMRHEDAAADPPEQKRGRAYKHMCRPRITSKNDEVRSAAI
jgi:hypothetical protein